MGMGEMEAKHSPAELVMGTRAEWSHVMGGLALDPLEGSGEVNEAITTGNSA